MAISNRTIEFMRFGDPVGVIRISDQYIRTVGSEPAHEVSFAIPQENFDRGMRALDYAAFRRAEAEAVRITAESFIKELIPHLSNFLGVDLPQDRNELLQIDLVTQAQELAQLPFEMLEEAYENLVITRRVRQAWPVPEVLRAEKPKILFAWAGPGRQHSVPYESHRELLEGILRNGSEGEMIELPNANKEKLQAELMTNTYTHVHLLAHGMPAPIPAPEYGKSIDLAAPLPAPVSLVLSGDDGTIERCAPAELADIFHAMDCRPECVTIATCHSAEVDPVRSGGTFAHAVHMAGVPVVIASQFALTKEGSEQLVDPFLANIIAGYDPRAALYNCRHELRRLAEKTYYDRIALTGYVQLDDGIEERLKDRRLKVQLRRLKTASQSAHLRLEYISDDSLEQKGDLRASQIEEIYAANEDFQYARDALAEMESAEHLGKVHLAELKGLEGSAFKRQAEAMWTLSQRVSASDSDKWLRDSRTLLAQAAVAYRRAASISRDHHWSWVQWLALEAVQSGTLVTHATDWHAAVAASEDAAGIWGDSLEVDELDVDLARGAVYALGSLCELYVLRSMVPGAGNPTALATTRDRFCTRALTYWREFGDDYPIVSTVAQLKRYGEWWGQDNHYHLPKEIVTAAVQLHEEIGEQCSSEHESIPENGTT